MQDDNMDCERTVGQSEVPLCYSSCPALSHAYIVALWLCKQGSILRPCTLAFAELMRFIQSPSLREIQTIRHDAIEDHTRLNTVHLGHVFHNLQLSHRQLRGARCIRMFVSLELFLGNSILFTDY